MGVKSCMLWLPVFVSRWLGALGTVTAKRPITVIAASLAVAMIFSIGWVRFSITTDPERVWVPQDSRSMAEKAFVEREFGRLDTIFLLYAELPGKAGELAPGALTVGALNDVFELDDQIKKINVEGVGQWTDVCWAIYPGFCAQSGITRFWLNSRQLFDASVGDSEERLIKAVNADSFPDGGQVIPSDAYISSTKDENRTVIGAEVLVWQYLIRDDLDQSQIDYWKSTADKIMSNYQPKSSDISFSNFHMGTVSKEVTLAAVEDLPLVVGAVTLLNIVCCFMLFRRDQVRSRMTLGAVGVTSVVLSMGMGFGICLMVGIGFSPMQQLLPFLLLGIGVDDMFVLVRGFDEAKAAHPSANIEFLMRRTMETSGVSITITSVTNLIAFTLGALSQLPAVRWFCAYAGISIFCDYLLQITFFLGFMVLSERRVNASRYDLMPWKVRKDDNNGEGQLSKPRISLESFIDRCYAPFALNRIVRVVVVILFVGLGVAGGFGASQLELGLKLNQLVRKGSKAQEFLSTFETEYAKETGGPLQLYFKDIDQADPENQQRMLQAWHTAMNSPYLLMGPNAPNANWLSKMLEFAEKREKQDVFTPNKFIRKDKFYSVLDRMMSDLQYKIWASDIVLRGNGTSEVVASRFPMLHAPADTSKKRAHVLLGSRDLVDRINKDIFEQDDVTFLHSVYHIFWESDTFLVNELKHNLIFAGVGVTSVNVVFLVHITAALLMVTSVLLVELGLFAVMWLTSIPLNSLTLLLLIMAIGLGIDYPVHILHKFLEVSGDSSIQRAHRALVKIGPAVSIGFLTTLSGVVLLGGSSSDLFFTLFRMLLATVLFAYAVGMLFVPGAMSFTNMSVLWEPSSEDDASVHDLTTPAKSKSLELHAVSRDNTDNGSAAM